MIQPSVSWLCVTPLAGPVLPEVKKIIAGADGSGAGSAGGSPPGSSSTSPANDGPVPPPGPYVIHPRRRSPARRLSASPATRSVWTSSALASLTARAWSISVAV